MGLVLCLFRQFAKDHVRVGHFTVFRIMHRNYGQEDNFILDHCLQVDFTEFVNLNRLIRFR